MTELDVAISELQLEIDHLGIPAPGTLQWWALRAKSHGVTLLKTLRVRNLTDPVAADAFRKATRIEMQAGPTLVESK